MDFRRRFEFGLAWRTIALVAALWLLALAIDDAWPARRPAGGAADRRVARWQPVELHPAHQFHGLAVRRIGALRGLFAALLRPQRRRLRRARRNARRGDQGASGAPHRRPRPKRAICPRSSTTRRARCWRSTRTAGSRCSTRPRGSCSRAQRCRGFEDVDALGPGNAAAVSSRPERARSPGWCSTAFRKARSLPLPRSRGSTGR